MNIMKTGTGNHTHEGLFLPRLYRHKGYHRQRANLLGHAPRPSTPNTATCPRHYCAAPTDFAPIDRALPARLRLPAAIAPLA